MSTTGERLNFAAAAKGDHICSICRDVVEQLSIAASFLGGGLEKGEKCIYVSGGLSREDAENVFLERGIDLPAAVESGRFSFLNSDDIFLKGGIFDPGAFIKLLEESERAALEEGCSGLRVAGEMSPVLSGRPDVRRLLEYEAALNNFLAGRRVTMLCQYSEDSFEPELLIDFMRAHPKVIVEGRLCENRFYETPPEFAARLQASPEHFQNLYRRMVKDIIGYCELQREKQYQAIFHQAVLDVVPDILILLDEELVIIWANEETARVTGKAVSELPGEYCYKLWQGRDSECHGCPVRGAFETGEKCCAETVTPDGRIWELRALPVLVDGAISGVIEIARDITAQKQNEEALRSSEEYYRQLLESLPNIICLLSPQGDVLYVNNYVQKVTGYSPGELLGRNWWSIFYPDEEHSQVQELYRDFLAGNVYDKRMELVTWKGEKRCISWNSMNLWDENGRLKEIVGIGTDITERKMVEEQLHHLQKMETIGQLAGGVAHDFNNLLTAISGYTGFLVESLEPGDRRIADVLEIRKAAERASLLTKQLLAFSRRQVLQPQVLDLNTVVGDMKKMLARIIGENIEIVIALAPELSPIKADLVQIEQVIMNLAVNARDALPGGGKLTMETANVKLDENYARRHSGVKAGDYVMLAVSDNGAGMTGEVRERVFEPFFTTKEKGHGTGLGLATVYGVVKQHGGNIWCYSEFGRGTTFKIYLPEYEPGPDNDKKTPLEAYTVLSGRTETILVVEDDRDVLQIAVRSLRRLGYRVIEASSGRDIMKTLQKEGGTVDLLITDVVMPGMSGPELAALLQKKYPGLKVLYVSGYTDNAIVHQEVLEEGVNFLEKPFTPEVLAMKVWEILSR